jgi:hypothetical protein
LNFACPCHSYETLSTIMTSIRAIEEWANFSAMCPAPARHATACFITSRLPNQRAQLEIPAPPSKNNREQNPKVAHGYQLFWFLLPNGNRVNELAASHEHYAAPVQGRIRHKRCPLRATPIYSVSTLSWLGSALKRLPSFALDSCSLATSLPGIKRKTYCHHPINLESNSLPLDSPRIRYITTGSKEKRWLVFLTSYPTGDPRR